MIPSIERPILDPNDIFPIPISVIFSIYALLNSFEIIWNYFYDRQVSLDNQTIALIVSFVFSFRTKKEIRIRFEFLSPHQSELSRFFSSERLTSLTKSTYLFIQKLSTNKFLDLDDDEYGRNSHRYRTRVDANAATLELLCLSCDDETGRFQSSKIFFFNQLTSQIVEKRMKYFLVCISIETHSVMFSNKLFFFV